LGKLFGMKGGPPSPQLASEIIPYLALPTFDDNLVLYGYQKFASSGIIAANVANAAQVRMRNPLAANIIVLIKQFWARSAAATVLNFFMNQPTTVADLGTVTSTTGIDGRGPSRAAAVASETSAVAATGAGAQFWTRRLNALNTDQEFLAGELITLSPGGYFEVDTSAINQDMTWNLVWLERYLEESERIGG